MAVISANFKLLGNFHFNTDSHHTLFSVGLQISNVLFRFFAGIFLKVVAFLGFKDFSSFSISVKPVSENENVLKCRATFSLISRMLGCVSYFLIAISIELSIPIIEVKICLFSIISNDFTAFSK